MYCENCGQEIDKAAKFCPECGTAVNRDKKAVKAAEKKPIYKRWWFWTLIVLLLLGSFGAGKASSSEETVPETLPPAVAPEELPAPAIREVPVATEAAPAEVEESDLDYLISLIDPILEENFENHSISYEDNILTINVWNAGIAEGATLAAAGESECLRLWDDIITNQKEMCKVLLELVQTMGFDDVGVAVNVLNDLNTENVLLTTFNGMVFYDSVND